MLTSLQIMERLDQFGDDKIGGAQWLTAHFHEFSERDKANMVQVVSRQWDAFPESAKILLWKVFSTCDAGRDFIIQNMRDRMVKQMVLMLETHMSPETMKGFVLEWIGEATRLHRRLPQ